MFQAVSLDGTQYSTWHEWYDMIILIKALIKALKQMVATCRKRIDMKILGSVRRVIVHRVIPMLYSIRILSIHSP